MPRERSSYLLLLVIEKGVSSYATLFLRAFLRSKRIDASNVHKLPNIDRSKQESFPESAP
jgi:hypothetical protein